MSGENHANWKGPKESDGFIRVPIDPYKLEALQRTRGVKNGLKVSTNILKDPLNWKVPTASKGIQRDPKGSKGIQKDPEGSTSVLRGPYILEESHRIQMGLKGS